MKKLTIPALVLALGCTLLAAPQTKKGPAPTTTASTTDTSSKPTKPKKEKKVKKDKKQKAESSNTSK